MNVCLAHGGDVSQPSGGTDRVTALAAGLQARDVDVTLVVPEPSAALPDRLGDVDVVPVSTARLGVDNAVTRAAAVTGRARAVAADRDAHLQLEHSSLAGVGTFRGCDGFVLDMHDIAYPRFDHVDTPAAPLLKRGVGWLERRAVDRARHVVVVSAYMSRLLREDWGVPADRVSVIPNGYFPDRVDGFVDAEPVTGRVCFLGTLHPKVDVQAVADVADLQTVSEVVVIGDGALRDEFDRLAERRSAVRTTGRLPDEEAFDLLASGEVVVNPQTTSDLQRSSSPVKLFYYAALGKPMVVTEGPSIVSELERADAACVAGSRAEFVEQVATLLSAPSRRRELADNARQAATEFTWDRRAEHLASVYRERDELRGAQ